MMNILVLEDQAVVREVITEIISDLDMSVRVAQADSLKTARSMLESDRWDVLVTDFQLGDGVSLELISELRQQGNDVSVVLISGFLTPERVQQAEQLGVSHLLAKPFQPDALSQSLHALLAPMTSGQGISSAQPARTEATVIHGRLLPDLFEMDRHLGLLFRMFSEMPNHQDVAEVCSRALSLGMEMARAKRGFIALFERKRKQLVTVALKTDQTSDPLRLALPSCHMDDTPFSSLLNGEDEILQMLGAEMECWPGVSTDNMAAVPVRLQAVPMGVMCLMGCEGDQPLNDQMKYMLKLLISQLDTLLDNRAVHAALADSMKDTLVALVRSLEARDRYTKNHSTRVSDLSVQFATDMGLGEGIIDLVRVGGLLHDIGKVGIPDEVLLKPGRYTEKEYAIMKAHPAIGDSLLKHMDTLVRERLIVRHHHERWDGRGYPDRLAGEDIPLEARIVCVADAIDAMTTHRVYRQAKPLSFCLEQLKLGVGTQFDPQVVKVAVSAIERGHVKTQAPPEELDRSDEALLVSAGLL